MRTLNVKAIIITDGKDYFIHGTSNETSADLFKKMHPIWDMDPATETAHYVEIPLTLPELEDRVTPNDADTQ